MIEKFHTCITCRKLIQQDSPEAGSAWFHTTGNCFCYPRDPKDDSAAAPDPNMAVIEVEQEPLEVKPPSFLGLKKAHIPAEEAPKTVNVLGKEFAVVKPTPGPVLAPAPGHSNLARTVKGTGVLLSIRPPQRGDDGVPPFPILGDNPKDVLGVQKVSISKLPPSAVVHASHAMMNGAKKYGPYNWRKNAVIASIYVDAACRHILSWFDGEELAADSGVHHLGHAIACLSILLDAQETGNLKDDRPVKGPVVELLERLNGKIKEAK